MSEEKKFIAKRLEEAQQLAGFTNVAIADELDVTPTAVGKWVKDVTPPSDENVIKLAKFLDVPTAFFFRDSKSIDLTDKLQCRSSSRKRAKDTKMVERKIEYFTETAEAFLNFFDIPEFKDEFPYLENPLVLGNRDIEEMATTLREKWGIGKSPIKTLGNLLFNKGIVLLKTDLPDSINGLSFFAAGRPFIVLGEHGAKSRDKMTLAHEFAHIVLHHGRFDKPMGKLTKEENAKVEADAYKFAGAFLLPAEAYLRDVFSISVECLLSLKPKWQVSAAAQIRRLKDLGEIDDAKYTQLQKKMSWMGQRKIESQEDSLVEEDCNQINVLVEKIQTNRPDLWATVERQFSELPKKAIEPWVPRSKVIEMNPANFSLRTVN